MTTEEAIARVDRRRFLPADVADTPGIEDLPVPFGNGQTVPTARMTQLFAELAELKPFHVVMEVGTGSGYQAAILGELVREVHTLEVRELPSDIHEKVPGNVTVYHRDAVCDLPDIQVDAILVTCSVPGPYRAWRRVLKDGGVIVVPVRGEIRKYVRNNFRLEDMGTFAYASFVDVDSPSAGDGVIDESGL